MTITKKDFEELKNMISKLNTTVKNSNKQINSLKDVGEKMLGALKKDVDVLKEKHEKLVREHEEQTRHVIEMEKSINFLKSKEKEKNLILFNLPENDEQNKNLDKTVTELFENVNN